MQTRNTAVSQNRSAHFLNLSGSYVPQLAGTKFRITKFFDQRSLHFAVLFSGKHFAEHIFDNCRNGKALHALSAPVRSDITGMSAPEIFRIVFKKHGIQLPTKPVDIEVFQRIFRPFMEQSGEVTEAGL